MKIILSSRMHHCVERVGILLVMIALIVGMPGCEPASCGSVFQYALNVFSTLGGMVTVLGEGTSPYPGGTLVTLVAKPDTGYRFVQWTGDVDDIDDVTSADITIAMNRAYSITANFIAQYDLTIDGTSGGEVITPGEGTFTYDAGTVVDLVAAPTSGYFFVEWTGDVGTIADINAAETTITMDDNYSITTNFEQIPPEQFTLTISSTAGGSVTAPGEGTRTYVSGTVVELLAEAEVGYQFVNWTGDVSTIANVNAATTNITMNGHYSIIANFTTQYDLTIDSTDGGEVATPGEGTRTYVAGTVVNLVATPASGYRFVNWTGNVNTIADVNADSTTITMKDDYTITANFALPIWDWYDLDAIRDNLGGSYVLMKDLDSASAGYRELASATANEGKGWQPIGIAAENDKFAGSFDGQEHEICDLFVDRPAESDVGLFGVVGEEGIIENVGLMDVNVAGKDSVGGLVGVNDHGTVSNSYSIGRVTGRWYVGGLVGVNNYGTVSNSYSTGSVTGKDSVGGLVGDNDYGTVSNSYSTGNVDGKDSVGGLVGDSYEGNVNNSYSAGSVTGKDSVGGLVGDSYEGNVDNSYSTGSVNGGKNVGGLIGRNEDTVSNSYSTGSVIGRSNVGGLAGHNSGSVSHSHSTGRVTGKWYVGGLAGHNTGTVSHSYSTGSVTGRWYVGGLVGQNSAAVSNCYATGRANGDKNVGGLVGQNSAAVSDSYATGSANGDRNVGGLMGGNEGTVNNVYSTGSVTGRSNVDGLLGGQAYWSIVSNFYAASGPNSGKNVGGLIGRNEGAVSNSVWDTQTSGQATSNGGTGKTTAEMQDIDTLSGAGWDVVAVANSGTRNTGYIWNIVDDATYAFLSWEPV